MQTFHCFTHETHLLKVIMNQVDGESDIQTQWKPVMFLARLFQCICKIADVSNKGGKALLETF